MGLSPSDNRGMNMIAERETEADVVDVEPGCEPDGALDIEDGIQDGTKVEAPVHGVAEWLERRPNLRRPFVENYEPRHRAERTLD
jgi:hypothetical protein